MFWSGYMPEEEDDKAPWAAQETSIDWSPCVITNLEVQVFKSEVRRSRFLTETTMRLSEIGNSISDIVSVVGIVWRVWIQMIEKNMNSYFGRMTGKIWIHIKDKEYEFIWLRGLHKEYEFISHTY